MTTPRSASELDKGGLWTPVLTAIPLVLLSACVAGALTPLQLANTDTPRPHFARSATAIPTSAVANAAPECPYSWGFTYWIDEDEDELDDGCEFAIAQRFAPVIYHLHDEPNLPSSVAWFLERTELRFRNSANDQDCKVDLNPYFPELDYLRFYRTVWRVDNCGPGGPFYSHRQLDYGRKQTFYLKDVEGENRKGNPNPREWPTYFHAYPRDDGGAEVQYWQFFPYNSGKKILGVELGFHGGDWEAVTLVVNKDGAPIQVRMLNHQNIDVFAWGDVEKAEETHVKVISGPEGHPRERYRSGDPRPFTIQQTWTWPERGTVTWAGGNVLGKSAGTQERTGEMLNLGEKYHPMPEMFFIRYTGLWGSLGSVFSGYWGAAFNDTKKDGEYLTAWCGDKASGMKMSLRDRPRELLWVDGSTFAAMRECSTNLAP